MAKGSKKSFKTPSKKTKPMSADLARLEDFCALMERHGLAELEFDTGGTKVKMRKQGPHSESAFSTHSHAPRFSDHAPLHLPTAQLTSEKPVAATNPNHKTLTSPFVGTFYRSPSPTAENYCKEGQMVKRGNTLCIVEAMKLMNEIESDFDGKVIQILVESGQPVEFGEPLFVIEV